MDPKRIARLSSVILRESSQLIRREVRDPRLLEVNLTRVELTPDGGHAILFYLRSLHGLANTRDIDDAEDRRDQERVREGLNKLSGWLRRQLAPTLRLRQAPEVSFREDRGLENSLRVQQLLEQIHKEAKIEGPATDPTDNAQSATSQKPTE